ncbi:Endonuclease/Exonuclease/phosphatase family protein [Shewanella sp. P1-14-1]|uniref:endonuclease/exonuclease/phosphatase family protein n=1 Tax=Shewanella sp. P1-14-1 TaxID=1723761 RepID=UPI0006E61AAD|nr:endonuclease/exonuclease/phosphatase family protein [Shewanella sp. P1-14-1]KPZ69705.1 Endonuclease/Exonuclease/phosphatase family protein [Shewanella sp. P1-14-1]
MTQKSSNNEQKKSPMFKVVSFNLFNFIEPPSAYYDFENIYSHQQWQKKCGWICDYLAAHQPDIIGFQEVFSPDALKALLAPLGYQYFAALDEPSLISDYVYQSPVVAIASKYPIIESALVTPDATLFPLMGIANDFSFSRKPLRAKIALAEFGECECYVVHLKSKRSGMGVDTLAESGMQGGADLMARQALGSWASNMQRGSEAALLFNEITKQRTETQLPVILMGDFNDTLQSTALEAFRANGKRVFRNDIIDPSLRLLNDKMLADAFAEFSLFDTYELFQTRKKLNATLAQDEYESGLHDEDSDIAEDVLPPVDPLKYARQATHYFGNTGSVLDYILASCEFDASHPKNLAEVSDYQTHDRHLVRPEYERDSDSTDHAPIMMTFTLRS